jgi:hypothetical protein
LHKRIFGESDDLVKKMETKPQLLVNVALNDNQVIGIRLAMNSIKESFIAGWAEWTLVLEVRVSLQN